MTIIPFQVDHIDAIKLREKGGIASLPNFKQICAAYEQNGGGWTLFSPDGIVCISGVFHIWGRVGMAWSFTSDLVEKYPLAYYRETKKKLNEIIKIRDLDRVYMVVRATDKKALRWADHLGFECEGLMRKYGPDGGDCFMYAKVS